MPCSSAASVSPRAFTACRTSASSPGRTWSTTCSASALCCRTHHLLVDIDDGYCDPEVACHVVSVLEASGASGVVLEDQKRPRRCGHFDGKQIMELDEYLAKIAAGARDAARPIRHRAHRQFGSGGHRTSRPGICRSRRGRRAGGRAEEPGKGSTAGRQGERAVLLQPDCWRKVASVHAHANSARPA